jgi:dienelactone hydrolase
MSLPPVLTPVEMTVLSADGVVLKGVLVYPERPPAHGFPIAVLAHQYPSTADSFAPLIEDLLDLGVAVLAFDERGHGSSISAPGGTLVIDSPVGFTRESFGTAFVSSATRVGFARIDDDIFRVASWGAVQNFVDPARVLLVGASVGGSGAVLAAPKIPGLTALITLGAAGEMVFGPDGRDRCRQAIAGIPARTFLASSEQDPFDGAVNVRTWSEGLSHVTSKLVPGEAHAMAIYYDVRDDLLAFLRAAFGGGR